MKNIKFILIILTSGMGYSFGFSTLGCATQTSTPTPSRNVKAPSSIAQATPRKTTAQATPRKTTQSPRAILTDSLSKKMFSLGKAKGENAKKQGKIMSEVILLMPGENLAYLSMNSVADGRILSTVLKSPRASRDRYYRAFKLGYISAYDKK